MTSRALIQAIQIAQPWALEDRRDGRGFLLSLQGPFRAGHERLNNLLAAPGFQAWLEGERSDIDISCSIPGPASHGLAIFSIAHLSDAERMFFVTLLLSQMVGWMRRQSGTTSLRAILYMDEIFGYFPPVANPPSKLPLMTLLKQARAFGLGVVLATQNPVDLDYKGLANTGTWFIGRLQTERDKARVLEGLEGASSSAGKKFDKGRMEQTLAGLGNRIFLMNNVHEDEPVVFETRWCLSYLRGPLTRSQIKLLMDSRRKEVQGARVKRAPTTSGNQQAPVESRPMLPPDVPQYFVPIRGTKPDGSELIYAPMLLGSSQSPFYRQQERDRYDTRRQRAGTDCRGSRGRRLGPCRVGRVGSRRP